MNRLWVRLSIAFLVVVWLAIGAIALIVNEATESSFREYLNRRDNQPFTGEVIDRLQGYYAANQTWDGAETLLPSPGSGQSAGQGRGQGTAQGGTQGGGERGGAAVLLADAAGRVVLASDADQVGTVLEDSARDRAVRLVVADETVGWLLRMTPGDEVLGATEEEFLAETTRWLVVAAIAGALLAVVAGALLAWQLTRPLRVLTDAAHTLAAGRLGYQVDVSGAAEIVDLGGAFNHMSRDLAEGEALRRRMAADVAHELRTPVSVLRGHLEAMIDGVFPLDAEHLAVAYDRTIHMSRLVDDLRLLTRAEAGQLPLNRSRVNAGTLVKQAAESFDPLAADAGITLRRDWADDLPPVAVDVDRIQQVLGNLLTNALRHTPQGGTITIRAWRVGADIRFAVDNTGQGLSADEAAHIFDPFWRAEEARQRDRGGSGLGLSISRQLLLLHGGRIWAESGPDQTTFAFELSAAGETA